MSIRNQKHLALRLLEWHGGQGSALYAVGSCMLSDCGKRIAYKPEKHRGHKAALPKAIKELEELRAKANFPEAVTVKDEVTCKRLANRLRKLGGAK